MIEVMLLGLGILAAEPPEKPPARPDAEAAIAPNADQSEALAKYNLKKAQTRNTANAQWNLAEWCEKNGLEAEAFVHYAAVIQLDPKRDAAWRKLGYKKYQGRWMTDAQIAEEAEQTAANKEWGLRLKKIHKDIHRGPKKAEAQAQLEKVDSPRAVQAVYKEFGTGGAADQRIAIQVFGQIDTPLSSKVLALMSIYGKNPEVRRFATETLRRRNPDDYLPTLVALMSDKVKYEVRPVGGPGSPGVLFVEGEKANFRRVYAPPTPSVNFRPGDIVGYDANGLPVLIRPIARIGQRLISAGDPKKPGSTDVYENTNVGARFSAAEMMLEAQRGAVSAQQQLEGDVQQIEAFNRATKQFNETVMTVARDASGQDLGSEPKEWRDALAEKGQYRKEPKKSPDKPTLDELVPIAYQPRFGELAFFNTNSVKPVGDM